MSLELKDSNMNIICVLRIQLENIFNYALEIYIFKGGVKRG